MSNPAQWVLVITNGLTLVGRLRDNCMDPVYQLERGLLQGPNGQLAVANRVTPLLMLSGVTGIDLPDGAIVFSFERLSKGEREQIEAGIKSAEAFRSQMRAAESGIVVAGPGVKLPPVKP